MSTTFTKLFSSITESTIWVEDDQTRLVWICMLAMADRYGRVWGSVPGLANRARVPLERVSEALTKFMSPDVYSRTPDNEGRRIEVIDGGWRLLNYAKYREIKDEEAIKESKRRYINARRAREKEAKRQGVTIPDPESSVDNSVENLDSSSAESKTVPISRPKAEAEAEAEADKDSKKGNAKGKQKRAALCDQAWLNEIQKSSAYSGVDVTREAEKSRLWLMTNAPQRQYTRRYVLNWLAKAERPMMGTPYRSTNENANDIESFDQAK